MAFNSLHFLLFFPIVLAGAWSLRRNALLRCLFLLVASYYFYMSWNWRYAGLILLSTLLDYGVGLGLGAARRAAVRHALLIASLVGNLGVLFVFKYYNFFAGSVTAALQAGGFDVRPSALTLLLPVGISFYTFQTLSYTIDVYRGQLTPTRNLAKFALFVSFFPQLVAGPIVRASHFLPQLDRRPVFDDRAAERGLGQLLTGLIKKVCIADVLGTTIVDPLFADPGACSSLALWLGMYAYAFQIYYDFAGYSDVAIGAARMLGYDLPINFNRPYTATSMRDFWRRWHISLSTWLRDYLYIPLGGGKCETWKVARNLAIVMTLGGLWHGAAWGFVLWGVAHGLFLGAGRIFHQLTGVNADRADQPATTRVARIALTFHLAAACFVLFRAVDGSTTLTYFAQMLAVRPGADPTQALGYVALLIAAAWEWTPRSWAQQVERVYEWLPAPAQAVALTTCLLALAAVSQTGTPFIYFQF